MTNELGTWWSGRSNRVLVRRYFESVEIDCFVVIRIWWWIKVNSSCVITMTKMKWSWIWFSARVRKVEMSPYFANFK